MIKDESAQAGGLFMVIVGIFVIGFFYVGLGAVMNQVQSTNNDMITDGTIPYSQEHYDGMNLIFRFWWGIPIFTVILFVIYGIKNALTREPGQV